MLFAAIGDISGGRWWAIVLGVLFAIVAITLLVASWTRWGQTKSLTKCIALAFLAHVWLLMYAYGTRMITPGTGGGYQGGQKTDHTLIVSMQSMAMEPTDTTSRLEEPEAKIDSTDNPESESLTSKPWEKPLPLSQSTEQALAELPAPTRPTNPPAVMPLPDAQTFAPITDLQPDESALAQFLTTSSVQTKETVATEILPPPRFGQPVDTSPGQSLPPSAARSASMPSSYQNRFSPNRMDIVRAGGGDENTEATVQLALEWLANAQSPDGGWYAADHGAGRSTMVNRPGPDGEYRQNTGIRANTAMTGMALLAFLGAGHHHLNGRYAMTVKNGLNYLRRQQLPSGDLSGRDQTGREDAVRFARMYSHGMASLAVSEAYAITADHELLTTVQWACAYTKAAMNPRSGGWRYEYPTEDPGDTSQFGWQSMLLQSATNAKAIQLTSTDRSLMLRFLDSVATGRDGGLATYRPRVGNYQATEQATPSMTAEAMASRLLLGFPVRASAAAETQRMLLNQLPGQGADNFYYWYYATLALYQLRGESTEGPSLNDSDIVWHQWNNALKKQLCSTQITSGPDKGSWNPTCVWGQYGGRVYTTALGCMSMEVYYRYLPLIKAQAYLSNR
jgi:hypothetical protein